MKKILEGVRILDLTRVLAGPFTTMILADLGAEVIKVELPKEGDESRKFGPFTKEQSMYFASVNRGKKSITVNLRKEKGQKIIKELAQNSHVLVENFKPGTMKKFNLDYEALKETAPHLVYASISGFGQTGPYSNRPAYDLIIQAMSGLMSITGEEEGNPVRVGSSISDLTSALFSVIAIQGALRVSQQNGKGQYIDIAMLDCQIALLENAIMRFISTGTPPKPIGTRHPSITPFQVYNSGKSKIAVAIGNDKLWQKFCQCIAAEELISDSRFDNNKNRCVNQPILEIIINKKLESKSAEEWYNLLTNNNIPCSPIHGISDIIKDDHVKARGMIKEINHELLGTIFLPNSPFKFSETPVEISNLWPKLGEHTSEILKDILRLSSTDLDELKEEEVI